MSRYFLAIPLPDPVKQRLAEVRPPKLPGVQLVRPDQMHVTLHFLGEMKPEDILLLKRVMEDVDAPRFDLSITGIGTFPSKGPPRIVWAGVQQQPLLEALQQELGESLQESISFQPEQRPYHPHITLARIKSPARRHQLEDYFDHETTFSIPAVPIDRFVLYDSSFSDGRLRYREEASWRLSE